MGQALKPMIMSEMVPGFLETALGPRSRSLKGIVTGKKPSRLATDIRGELDELIDFYDMAGVTDYAWKPFGPKMRNAEWSYFSRPSRKTGSSAKRSLPF